MKIFINLFIIFLISTNVFSREKGETEITTEDGVEVYQNEKYYLLKKNVEIKSDSFNLSADDVKINFENSLYDITALDAKGNVNFNSFEFNLKGFGNILNFKVKNEELNIQGIGSELKTDTIEMFSDGSIKVNNVSGNFSLKGPNSKLINESIIIEAESIDGKFFNKDGVKQISILNVIDKKESYVKNNDTEMFAKKINFDHNSSLIELIDEVTIIRNDETISGDYGTLDTKNNSYKIKSNDQTKVKVIIQNNE